ncbi:MAG: hypothetical protein RL490_315 [Pseudomonadota bacterium]
MIRKALLLLVPLLLASATTAQAPGLTTSDRASGAQMHPQLLAQFGGAYAGPQAA